MRPTRLIPPGTLAVGAGLAVLGLASYLQLALAGHQLDPAAMSSVSVFWSLAFAAGPGLFLPFEQEITRLVAGRRAHQQGAAPVLRRAALLAATTLTILTALGTLAAGPIAERLFAADTRLVWSLLAAMAAMALAYTTRGMLAGTGQFGWYGLQLGIDGAARIALTALLGPLHQSSALTFTLVLTAAPLLAVAATLPATVRAIHPGPPMGWASLCRGLALLTATSLLAQLVANIPVINVRLLAPADTVIAAAMLSALILARVPMFLFASLQSSLLAGLAHAAATGDRPGYWRLLRRTLAVVSLLGVAGGAAAVAGGPWLCQRLFNTAPVLGGGDFAWLAAATVCYLWALVLGQAVLTLGRHQDQALAWAVGVAALLIVTAAPAQVALRVERGYAIGTATTVAVLVAVLARETRAQRRVAQPTTLAAAGVA